MIACQFKKIDSKTLKITHLCNLGKMHQIIHDKMYHNNIVGKMQINQISLFFKFTYEYIFQVFI